MNHFTEAYLKYLNESPATAKLTAMLANIPQFLSHYSIKPDTARVVWFVDEILDKAGNVVARKIRCSIVATRIEKRWADLAYAKEYAYADRDDQAKMERPVHVEQETPDFHIHSIVGWKMEQYPACCAMYQANYFHCTTELPDMVHLAATTLCKGWQVMMGRQDRLIFNFVERSERGWTTYTSRERGKSRIDRQAAKVEGEFRPGTIDYEPLYDWAKSQAGFQEMLCYNDNSSNIIHTALVVIDPNQE